MNIRISELEKMKAETLEAHLSRAEEIIKDLEMF